MGGTNRTVLVVEDEDSVRRMVARRLLARGHGVVTASSRSEALRQRGPFDFGVFDIGLGDCDGIDLAVESLREGRVARAIFYTGGAGLAQIIRAIAVGIVVSKGDSIETLFRALE